MSETVPLRLAGDTRFALAFNQETGRIDHRVTTANTHLITHAGRLFALEEGGFPYEVTPDLATIGAHATDGVLQTPMTAHPKTCPITGGPRDTMPACTSSSMREAVAGSVRCRYRASCSCGQGPSRSRAGSRAKWRVRRPYAASR